MSTTEAENKEIVRTISEEVLGAGDLALADEYIAEDCVQHGSLEDIHGPDEYKEFVAMIREAFPDLDVESQELIAEGNKVFDRHRATGTHKGAFMGVSPTGRSIEFEGMFVARIEDGQVIEAWGQADIMGLMQQLGMFPPGPGMMLKMIARTVKDRLLGSG